MWRISVDVGGTFTDCVAVDPRGVARSVKVLSSGSVRAIVRSIEGSTLRFSADDQFFEALVGGTASAGENESHIVSAEADGVVLDRSIEGLSAGDAVELRSHEPAPVLAARVVTRTPAGRPLPGCDFRLATTRATNALLERRHARVGLITTEGFADLLTIGDQTRPDVYAWPIVRPEPITRDAWGVPGRLDPGGRVVVALDEDAVRAAAREAKARGVETIAIALVNAWADPAQERRAAELCKEEGFEVVVCSAELAPRLGLLVRAQSAALEAALRPVVTDYLRDVAAAIPSGRLSVLTSAGGLSGAGGVLAVDTLLSGPAGGVVGAAAAGKDAGFDRVLSFDMGGTSTDAARIDTAPELAPSHRVGGLTVARPGAAIETVAAGGGSVCWVGDGRPRVGPISAGADPGPACYGRGGPLTVTDANLLLGRIDAGSFGLPVDRPAAERAADEVQEQLGASDRDVMLAGFLSLADEAMAEAMRAVSVRKGYDPADHALVAFGGAGPQHACSIAQRLGVRTVLIPPRASLLSAVGLAAARPEGVAQKPVLAPLDSCAADLEQMLAELREESSRALGAEPEGHTLTARLRMVGQESSIELDAEPVATLTDRFAGACRRLHGREPDRAIELVELTARAHGAAPDRLPPETQHTTAERTTRRAHDGTARREVACVPRGDIQPGETVQGPAIIHEPTTQTWLPAGWCAQGTENGELRLDATGAAERPSDGPLAREIVIHRLSAIAEQMGEALERAAVSVNVKDRRDYSCGVLDAGGRLVASAAHLPVHLGALGPCVRAVLAELGTLAPGEAALTNHPAFGGSHLPDLTVVQPVDLPGGRRLGYVASRAHHAEIGGLEPGSMPAAATNLAEEGVPIPPTVIARHNTLDEQTVRALLTSHRLPTRAIGDNLSDLRAQVVAGARAAELLAALAAERGAGRVGEAMDWVIGHTASVASERVTRLGDLDAACDDTLDDGTPLRVRVRARDGRLTLDFTGTGPAVGFGMNAPLAVTRSAAAYAVRLLVDHDLPLNDGFLGPIDLIAEAGSILNPAFTSDPESCPPVAGGNVETSQRVTDALLRALGVSAGAPGTMNNVLIGSDAFSVYETICSGSAATPDAPGVDAVHQHMTNTAITDAEVLEHRFPLRLLAFEIVPGTGGAGAHKGGDGARRVYEALSYVRVSVLTQRRSAGAPGARGGRDGKPGRQWIERAGGGRTPLAWAQTAQMNPGDRLVIETPGGGGWGAASQAPLDRPHGQPASQASTK